jgi:hypothetical protein
MVVLGLHLQQSTAFLADVVQWMVGELEPNLCSSADVRQHPAGTSSHLSWCGSA